MDPYGMENDNPNRYHYQYLYRYQYQSQDETSNPVQGLHNNRCSEQIYVAHEVAEIDIRVGPRCTWVDSVMYEDAHVLASLAIHRVLL
jgi:hypothetical protein